MHDAYRKKSASYRVIPLLKARQTLFRSGEIADEDGAQDTSGMEAVINTAEQVPSGFFMAGSASNISFNYVAACCLLQAWGIECIGS